MSPHRGGRFATDMDTTTENAVSPLEYLRPVWRFRWGALMIVLIAMVATYVYFDQKPRTFETSTQLYVGQSDINGLLSAQNPVAATSERSLANQARLVTTPQVASVVIRKFKLATTPDSLLPAISVRPDSSADFLTIVAQASSGLRAAQLVNGFAEGYLEVRADQANSQIDAQLKTVRQQLANTSKGGSTLATRTVLLQQVQQLESAAVNPPSVGVQLSAAQAPSVPIAPRPKRNAAFAAALAFLLALVLAYLLDRSDRRLRDAEAIEEMFDTAILAEIPRVRNAVPGHGARGTIAPELKESYHTLRVNLELLRAKQAATSLLVASGLPGEGKSTVARNLALAYRDAGARVVILDADLRRPSIAGLFDLTPAPGMADVLRGSLPVTEALQSLTEQAPQSEPAPEHVGRLDVLAAGDGGENPGLLFHPGEVRRLIQELGDHYDVVLIDTPPVLVVSDTLALAPEVDGVVLVGRIGVTTDASAQRVQRTFETIAKTRIMGAVVNGVAAPDLYTYYGHYGAQRTPESANGTGAVEAPDPATRA